MLADEPTGNLDSLMAREVMDLLEEINEMGTTIVMVTHDPELARRAHRNVHVIDGQIDRPDFSRTKPAPGRRWRARARCAVAQMKGRIGECSAYHLRLGLESLRRNPVLTALMISAIGLGIAASMITITVYHGRAGHPIWWKADKLYAVTMDNRDEDKNNRFASFQRHPEYPPFQVTYLDAEAIYKSDIPTRAVKMVRSSQVIAPFHDGEKPLAVDTRVTTADFFKMFDVPFIYGGGWSRADDEGPAPVVVISKYVNQKLFGGTNSVGKSLTLGDTQYRIIGVIDAWSPTPRFYDLNNNGFDLPENLFMPWGWPSPRSCPATATRTACDQPPRLSDFERPAHRRLCLDAVLGGIADYRDQRQRSRRSSTTIRPTRSAMAASRAGLNNRRRRCRHVDGDERGRRRRDQDPGRRA